MCGIAGYIGKTPLNSDRRTKILKAMAHRGPDDSGYFEAQVQGSFVQLFHRRLAIIDLDPRSVQPMSRGSGVLCYNGELYNYLELREKLSHDGIQFESTSDTEVLLQCLNVAGTQALDTFEGMWAFAYLNLHENQLVLSRDRFGEKPLFLYQDDTGFYFASELNTLLGLLRIRPSINTDQVYRYLVHGYRSLFKQSDTFFEGVTLLESGHNLLVDLGTLQSHKEAYWGVQREPALGRSYHEVVQDIRESLFKSVELRLRSDVPISFCLSGGVDSNALAGIASKIFNYDVHGFTIAHEDARYSEMDIVKDAVSFLGVEHTAVPLNASDFWEKLRGLIRHHGCPIFTISYYVHSLLMEAMAAAGYKVSVSGTGADEIFSGYYDHHLLYLHSVRDNAELHAKSLKAWSDHIAPTIRNPLLKNPDLYHDNEQFREHVYSSVTRDLNIKNGDWFEPFHERDFGVSLMRNRMLNELFGEVIPGILLEDDLNAMGVSIENRSPFLDRGLFEAMLNIPTDYLLRDGFTKAVLRDAVEGVVEPRVLQNRTKVGFNAPIQELLDINDPVIRRELTKDSPIFDFIKRDRFEELLGTSGQYSNELSKFIFSFVSAKIFLDEFS